MAESWLSDHGRRGVFDDGLSVIPQPGVKGLTAHKKRRPKAPFFSHGGNDFAYTKLPLI
ncbi:MAG: hypothetical protein ABTQ93_10600 [Candidatus Competibacter denitrificans]